MRHVLSTIFVTAALLPACGDDGRADSASATAVPTSPTTVSSFGTTEGMTATGTSASATEAPTGGGSGSDSDGTTATTGPVATTGTVTTFPETSTSLPNTTGFDPPTCDPVMKATIRDFRVDHPDFEDYTGDVAYKGIVQATLGADQKPIYAHAGATPQTTGPVEFAQWYRDVANVNMAFEIEIPLTEVMPGQFTYQNNAFFPIDGQGWGNEGNGNNFHFTTEIHTEFTYQGGEVFTFTGDDDLWLFINGKLAIDLGGLHPELTDTLDLDANAGSLGIQVGGTYAMDIFHAERHTDQSNFRIDTSIECFMIPG